MATLEQAETTAGGPALWEDETMKSRVVKTENGWEPAFFQPITGWTVEPGFARPTRREALSLLDQDERDAARCDAASRQYAAGYAFACGYRE